MGMCVVFTSVCVLQCFGQGEDTKVGKGYGIGRLEEEEERYFLVCWFVCCCYSLLLVLGAGAGLSLRDFDLGREIAPNVVVGGLVGGAAVEQGTVRRAVAVHRAVLPVCGVAVGGAVGRHAAVAGGGGSVAVGQGEGGGGGRGFLLLAGSQGAGLVRFVRALVELVEQEEEHDGVHSDPPDERLRVVAVDEEQLERVHHDGDKLDHLQGGEVLLPPQVLLELGSEGREQVVRVHHDVDERVEQTEEGAVATGSELDAEPHGHGHASVVNDVQRRHLTSFFAHHEEERIKELCELREVVPPTGVHHP